MSPGFRSENTVKKFIELNVQMFQSNQRLTATHPYSSQWYTWPFMTRPIFYWVNDNARIYFFGNPIIWWGSTVAVLLSLMYIVRHRIIRILLGGYFLNLLPFIGIKRVMFLYHYLTGLIFAILILIYLIEKQKHARKIFIGLAIASVAAFIYFAPLTYGLPLSPKAYETRVWLPSWR